MEGVTHAHKRSGGSTIYEVARRAGVSVATVSRLLNESGYVSARARERIEAAIDELRYEPNSLARSLTTKRTGMLALLLTDIANPFSAQIARGVQEVAQANGYVPIICSINDDPAAERETVRTLWRKRVDGIILTPTQGERSRETMQALHGLCERGMAMVCIGHRPLHPHADEVSTDTASGARAAVAHLVALGHRRIAFIGGPISRGIAVGRLRGYEQGLAEAGLAIDMTLVREGELDQESGRRETLALLDLPDPPTGVLCVNDLTAFGALAALGDRGLRVPDDISVVGFDDVPLATLVQPPLTTIRQPTRELGHLAARFLLQRIARRDGPHQGSVLPCQLVVRASSGPAPIAAANITTVITASL